MEAKRNLDNAAGSIFKKYSRAKEYKQVTKALFIVVEVSIPVNEQRTQFDSLQSASQRLIYRDLQAQITRAMGERGTPNHLLAQFRGVNAICQPVHSHHRKCGPLAPPATPSLIPMKHFRWLM